MSQWLSTQDGQEINFDNVRQIKQVDKSIIIVFTNGDTTRVDCTSAANASSSLAVLNSLIGLSATSLSVNSITPSSAPSGSAVNAVVIGSGFSQDIDAFNVFLGSIHIGLGPAATVTYVNDSTLLIAWSAGPPGVEALTYTSVAGQVIVKSAFFTNE